MVGMNYERLDEIAISVAKGDLSAAGVLSTGERLYVALAANSIPLLEQSGYTIAEALARLDDPEIFELIHRWRYRGNPAKFSGG